MPFMRPETSEKLIELNRVFYEDNAESFSSTRYAIQPGVRRLIPEMLKAKTILDLGCGNGNLALALQEAGFEENYLGLDHSHGLINDALKSLSEQNKSKSQYQFQNLDLSLESWNAALNDASFDLIVSFATIHHIPGLTLQHRFFKNAAQRLAPLGLLMISCWQPLNSPRLRARLQDWSLTDVDPNELTAGDLLLDWRANLQADSHQLRYVHQFSADELLNLGSGNGLSLIDSFHSDGAEGTLGFYQIWQKP